MTAFISAALISAEAASGPAAVVLAGVLYLLATATAAGVLVYVVTVAISGRLERRGAIFRFWLLPIAAIALGLVVTAWSVWNVLR